MSNFELRTDPTMLWIRDTPVDSATSALLNPTNANAIDIGEWFELTQASNGKKAARASGALPSFCFYAEKGRSDLQISQLVPLLRLGEYIADTKIMNAAGLAEGDLLKVDTVALAGVNRSGLVAHAGAADTDFVVAHCVRLPANNNNYLRFHRVSPNRLA